MASKIPVPPDNCLIKSKALKVSFRNKKISSQGYSKKNRLFSILDYSKAAI
jgi:hypothetical protein